MTSEATQPNMDKTYYIVYIHPEIFKIPKIHDAMKYCQAMLKNEYSDQSGAKQHLTSIKELE